MPLAGGNTFRSGIFIRSGSPHYLKPEEVQEVKERSLVIEEHKAYTDVRACPPDGSAGSRYVLSYTQQPASVCIYIRGGMAQVS